MEESPQVRHLTIDEKFKVTINEEFEIKEIIGFGSFGVVSKVVRKKDKRSFAMKKIFLKKLPNFNNALQETLQEIAVLSQSSHPHIINLIGYEILENEISYIMELMNYSLEDYMKEKAVQNMTESYMKTTLPEITKGVIIKVFYQSLSALNYLLSNFNMSHRDIKPENILLDENFDVKLSDFGTLKVMQSTTNKGFLTRSETIVGTPCYLAPELKKALMDVESGHAYSLKPKVNFTKCDVFSLGMSILRVIAGDKFETNKGSLNNDEESLRKFMIEVKNGIPLEIYDTLFIMMTFDVNIRPDIRMLHMMVQKKENLHNKIPGFIAIKEETESPVAEGTLTSSGLFPHVGFLNLQKKQSEIMDLNLLINELEDAKKSLLSENLKLKLKLKKSYELNKIYINGSSLALSAHSLEKFSDYEDYNIEKEFEDEEINEMKEIWSHLSSLSLIKLMLKFDDFMKKVTMDFLTQLIREFDSKLNKYNSSKTITISVLKDENTLKYEWSKFIRFEFINKILQKYDGISDLHISHFSQINDSAFTNQQLEEVASALKEAFIAQKIERFTCLFQNWKNLTDSGVCKLAEAVSQFSIGLTSLNFSFVSWELSDKVIEKVADTITKFNEYLTSLMIGFESGYITDYGLNILAEKLKVFEGKNLKNLSLYLNSKTISDIGISNLCETLKLILVGKVTRLTLCFNSWVGLISDEGFEKIVNVIEVCAKKLKKLSLGFYSAGDKLTEISIEKIGIIFKKKLLNLEEFSFFFNNGSEIRRTTLEDYLTQCLRSQKKLKNLFVLINC